MNTHVKICGVTRLDDALLAAELGASAIGFIFWPGSPRFVDPFRAKRMATLLPPFVSTVGVFVNQPPEHVNSIARLLNLAAIQLHGDEDPARYMRTGLRTIKAVPVAADFADETLDAVPAEVTILLDAHDRMRRGGTGQAIDWRIAARVAARRRDDPLRRPERRERAFGSRAGSPVWRRRLVGCRVRTGAQGPREAACVVRSHGQPGVIRGGRQIRVIRAIRGKKDSQIRVTGAIRGKRRPANSV